MASATELGQTSDQGIGAPSARKDNSKEEWLLNEHCKILVRKKEECKMLPTISHGLTYCPASPCPHHILL